MDPVIIAAVIMALSSIAIAVFTGLNARFSRETRDNSNHIKDELVEAVRELAELKGKIAGLLEGEAKGRAEQIAETAAREEGPI